jgi:diketogulonate reductase-like aldo/keto reductase
LAYNDVIRSIENSLKRLRTEYIDIYYIHWPNPKIPIEDTLAALMKLKKEGKIRGIGLSNFYINKIKLIESLCHIDSIEMEYSIFERFVEYDILPFCREKDISFVAYSPLNQGAVNIKDYRIEMVNSICQKYDKTFFQIILNWVHSNKGVFPIPKSAKELHLIDNVNSVNFEMEGKDKLYLSDIFKFKIVSINPSDINLSHSGRWNQSAFYSTAEEALQNKLNFSPSPYELAQELKKDNSIKPIKVMLENNEYSLIEGRLRYWAWVLAFGENTPIIASINEI